MYSSEKAEKGDRNLPVHISFPGGIRGRRQINPRHPGGSMKTGSKLVIIGDGEFARIAHEYFTHDSPHTVVGSPSSGIF
jgi:hypothetical protein